jgi:hypothetical protein
MKGKNIIRLSLGLAILAIVIVIATTYIIEPWLGRKILTFLKEKTPGYTVLIDKVNVRLFSSVIEFQSISINSNNEAGRDIRLEAEIESVKIKRISILKALFKKEVSIRQVVISNSKIHARLPLSTEKKSPVISPLSIRIENILLDSANMAIESTANAASWLVKQGVLKIYDLHLAKLDTLSKDIIRDSEFEAEELFSVSADSMYSYKADSISYSAFSNILHCDSLLIKPNYKDYDFTSRYKYQKNRIDACVSNISLSGFNSGYYLETGNLICSYIEINKMDLRVFKDKRKEFRHVNKPQIQDLIYSYPAILRIDSVYILSGNIIYTEHAEKANEPGTLSFNDLNAKIYKITNDTIYKAEAAYLELYAHSLLMGNGKLNVSLRGKIFDSQNTFIINGSLKDMEASKLNPFLEKSAAIYATSGKIDDMSFRFTANSSKANGKMTMLYNGLNISVKNKQTDDTTALKEKFISLIANVKVLNSNPIPNEKIREGIIEYERDPERFLFGYVYKSVMSGIKSIIIKTPKSKENSKDN